MIETSVEARSSRPMRAPRRLLRVTCGDPDSELRPQQKSIRSVTSRMGRLKIARQFIAGLERFLKTL